MQKATESQRERWLTDLGECEMEKGLNSISVPFFFFCLLCSLLQASEELRFPFKMEDTMSKCL